MSLLIRALTPTLGLNTHDLITSPNIALGIRTPRYKLVGWGQRVTFSPQQCILWQGGK